MKRHFSALTVLSITFLFAQPTTTALKVGTLGVGVDLVVPYSADISFRLNANGFSYNDNRTIDQIDYDSTLSLKSLGVLVDYYPQQSGFRLSGGLYINGNRLEGSATPTASQTLQIGNDTYTANEIGRLDTAIEPSQTISPYIGLGWESKKGIKEWSVSLDLGVIYQGSPDVKAEATINPSVPDAIRTQIESNIEIERQNIANEVKDYQWYPVIMIGFTYTF